MSQYCKCASRDVPGDTENIIDRGEDKHSSILRSCEPKYHSRPDTCAWPATSANMKCRNEKKTRYNGIGRIALEEMALDEITLDEMALDEMALDEITLDEMALDEMVLDEMTLDDMASDNNEVFVICSEGNNVKYPPLKWFKMQIFSKENGHVEVTHMCSNNLGIF